MGNERILFFLNWIGFLALCLLCWNNLAIYYKTQKLVKINGGLFLLVGIIGSTFFIISADYYGYIQVFRRLIQYTVTADIEPFYWWLARILEYDIFLFRLTLVSIIYISYWYIVQFLNIPHTISYTIIILLAYNINATVLRSSACDTIVWVGVLIYYKIPNVRTFICLLLCLVGGWFLHKSAFMIVFLFMMSYLPLKKYQVQFYILLFPIGVIIVRYFIPIIFQYFFDTSGYLTGVEGTSFIGCVKQVVGTGYTIALSIYILCGFRRFRLYTNIGDKLYKVFFWAFYCRLLFLFGGSSRFIGERLFAHALIPEVILVILLFVFGTGKMQKQLLYLLLIFILITQLNILVVYAFNSPIINSNTYINV